MRLSTTDVGRLAPAEKDAGSEVSEWERREREEERRAEAEELGATGELGAGEELPLFLPTPSFMASADENWGAGYDFLRSSFLFGFLPFVIALVRIISLGTGQGGGQRGSCNVLPPRGQRTDD